MSSFNFLLNQTDIETGFTFVTACISCSFVYPPGRGYLLGISAWGVSLTISKTFFHGPFNISTILINSSKICMPI